MAWTKLKDIFATKKEINEVRDSLSQSTFPVDVESIYNGSIYGISYGRFHLITSVGDIHNSIGKYSQVKIGTVPFRLARQVDDVGMTNDGDAISFQVAPDGSIYARTFNLALSSPVPVRFSVGFIAQHSLSRALSAIDSTNKDFCIDLNQAANGLMAYAQPLGSKNTPAAVYGVVLTLGNYGNIDGTYWLFQLAFGTNDRLYFRSCINGINNWSAWKTVC